MNELRKLVDGHEAYPPSELLWRQLIDLIQKKNTKTNRLLRIKEQMEKEVNRYRPSLPEPVISRFYYNDCYYYLDPKGKIYEMDNDNPMVGNQVGEIRGNEVILEKETIKTLEEVEADPQELYEEKYYVSAQSKNVYRGFHPQHPYVYHVGHLSNRGKIDLI